MGRIATVIPPGFDREELASLCSSLDEVEQAAQGYGELLEATITSTIRGGTVRAVYLDRSWHLHFTATGATT